MFPIPFKRVTSPRVKLTLRRGGAHRGENNPLVCWSSSFFSCGSGRSSRALGAAKDEERGSQDRNTSGLPSVLISKEGGSLKMGLWKVMKITVCLSSLSSPDGSANKPVYGCGKPHVFVSNLLAGVFLHGNVENTCQQRFVSRPAVYTKYLFESCTTRRNE